eukprot:822901-Amphidinium_carterae.1
MGYGWKGRLRCRPLFGSAFPFRHGKLAPFWKYMFFDRRSERSDGILPLERRSDGDQKDGDQKGQMEMSYKMEIGEMERSDGSQKGQMEM